MGDHGGTDDGEARESSHSLKRRRSDQDAQPALGRRKTACQTCRNRKVKCDLKRPVCSLCEQAGNSCVYLTEPPKQTLESVAETLTGRLDVVTRQLDDLKAIVQASDSGSTRPTPISPVVSSHITSPPVQPPPIAEPSRDFLRIPPHRTTADAVLMWPVFHQRYEPNYLVRPLLSDPEISDPHPYSNTTSEKDNYALMNSVGPLDDEKIPVLVDSFLLNVHTKNPVLDVEALLQKSRQASIHGLGWDAWSCCILLACALGSVAKPFKDDATSPRLASLKELQMGEHCFVLACRRIGLLKQTTLAAQCHFFAGVYLMYTLRPMLSWQHFHQAAITYQLYLKTNGRLLDNFEIIEQSHAHLQPGSAAFRKQSRLEQRLYWSCFKSEAEFRVELPLPQSEIADYDFPKLFPSPPSPPQPAPYVTSVSDPHSAGERTHVPPEEPGTHDNKTVRQTESWYYYLTEVALRRIGNRIINTFFVNNRESWMCIEPYLDIAVEFEAQVSSWYANLPPTMQRYETNSTIRAPRRESVAGIEIDAVSQELSWATENRLLEMRSWLYQPFLYYLVHARPLRVPSQPLASPVLASGNRSTSLASEPAGVLWNLIERGIDCNMTILETRSVPHRHHGLWYDLRAIMTSSLILLAIVRSGNIDLIPGGAETLVGASGEHTATHASPQRTLSTSSSNGHHHMPLIGGRFGKVLEQLRFWSAEAPDMARHASVLEQLIFEIMV